MTRAGTVLLTTALVVALVVLTAALAACGNDSDGLSVLDGGAASPTPSASPTTASASPTVAASPTPTETPTDDTAGEDSGGTGSGGDLSADEFSAYLDQVQPWYEEITAVEAKMINVIAQVEEMQISPGQGGRRMERLGWKLDPPVTELAAMSVPPALDKAHTAWLDGISYEAQAFARLYEQMNNGTYQRGQSDPEYDKLFQQASDKWDEWRQTVQSYESSTGVEAPWMWYGE